MWAPAVIDADSPCLLPHQDGGGEGPAGRTRILHLTSQGHMEVTSTQTESELIQDRSLTSCCLQDSWAGEQQCGVEYMREWLKKRLDSWSKSVSSLLSRPLTCSGPGIIDLPGQTSWVL